MNPRGGRGPIYDWKRGRKLADAGMSQAAIAQELGCTEAAVNWQVRKWKAEGWQPPKHRQPPPPTRRARGKIPSFVGFEQLRPAPQLKAVAAVPDGARCACCGGRFARLRLVQPDTGSDSRELWCGNCVTKCAGALILVAPQPKAVPV